MRLPKLTKAQINEALTQTPLHQILNIDRYALTTKQMKFCEHLATGETKAGSYRKAYNAKGTSKTMANNGHKLANRADIQAITEAIKKAIEFEKSYTAGQIRALVVQRLTQEAISDESNPSVRVNALKALGTIAGVDAFQHVTVSKKTIDSDKARDDLLSMLKQALNDNARTIEQSDDDIEALMRDIEGGLSDSQGTISDPHTPLLVEGTPESILHTIPDTQSPSKSKATPLSNPKEPNE